jgi:hypothetical protein
MVYLPTQVILGVNVGKYCIPCMAAWSMLGMAYK